MFQLWLYVMPSGLHARQCLVLLVYYLFWLDPLYPIKKLTCKLGRFRTHVTLKQETDDENVIRNITGTRTAEGWLGQRWRLQCTRPDRYYCNNCISRRRKWIRQDSRCNALISWHFLDFHTHDITHYIIIQCVIEKKSIKRKKHISFFFCWR